MVKTKNLVILGVVLVVWLGTSLFQKNAHRKATSQPAEAVLVPDGFVPADLSRITLGQGGLNEAVVLTNTPTGWMVDTAWNARASLDRIESLVRNVTGLTGEFRSDSGEVLGDYGLGDNDALLIRAYNPAGDLVIALDVGGKPERHPGNFVRQPDNNKVYVTQKNLLGQVGIYGEPEAPGNRYFLELQALQEDRLEVDRMVVDNGDQRLEFRKVLAQDPVVEGAEDAPATFDRNTWEWRLAGEQGAALAKTKVDAVLNSLVAIRATDLVDPQVDLTEYGLDQAGRQAKLFMQDGRVLQLNFGRDREAADGAPAGTYMQMDGESTVWVVTEYAVNNIFKDLAELLAE